ncbi:MAG: hydroxyacid dehydrogenase [Paenibacillaceae bacterium]|nr:hydroxyacid dehydrogenase [Paenibacillaceae bacterium]
MNMLMTLPEGDAKRKFFPPHLLEELRGLGTLRENPYGRVMTQEELALMLPQTEVCIVLSWGGTPRFTEEVLDRADALKLIVTPGGSVAPFITEAVYDRGITVCSANRLMAMYTAEGALAYMLAAVRDVVRRQADLRRGVWNSAPCRSLFQARVGFVGLGTVGRHLLELLRPFQITATVYDPYVTADALAAFPYATLGSLEQALAGADIVSLHASKTEETYRLLNKERLALLRDGAILVNTARGALIDEQALAAELRTGRIYAALDVYEEEPLPQASPLRETDNAFLMPHVAGQAELTRLAAEMVAEIARHKRGEALTLTIARSQFRLMTR